jgi:hypothetical protein
MPGGMPVNRNFVLVLTDGTILIDWGDHRYQDIETGEFKIIKEKFVCHRIMDDELKGLKQSRKILDYDSRLVYFGQLPEIPFKPME